MMPDTRSKMPAVTAMRFQIHARHRHALSRMKPHCIILFSIGSLLLAAEPPTITRESAATFYRGYKRLTAEPRFIAPLTAALCRVPDQKILDREREITGPHTRVAVHIYASPTAVDSMAANAAEFPVGAVIVKEKLQRDRKTVAEIGGMVKRPRGYDPANGDWEFFFSAAGGDFSTGKLANCVDCHNGGKRDHVFSVWNLQSK